MKKTNTQKSHDTVPLTPLCVCRELIQPGPGRTNYYEKVCLQAPACEKAWIYERVVGYLLAGYDNRIVGQVSEHLSLFVCFWNFLTDPLKGPLVAAANPLTG